MLLPEIGPKGHAKLARAKVVVVGCGALGTYSLSFLARAGVGDIAVIDRDIVDITNLQRQTLFSEADVGRPKAKVAEEALRKVNSEVKVRGMVADLNFTNIEKLVKDVDLVVDATDNMDTRYLVNDACVKHEVPWIYGGAVGISGMIFAIVPGGPCLRCLFPSVPQPGELPTCDTVGIINTLPSVVSSFQVTEGFKILMGKPHTKEMIVIDVWNEEVQKIRVKKNPRCPTCGAGDYEFLSAKTRKLVVSMCGRNAVQIVPARPGKTDLKDLGKKLSKLGKVRVESEVLRFVAKDADLTVFRDGRTIVSGTTDMTKAKTLFSKYVGD